MSSPWLLGSVLLLAYRAPRDFDDCAGQLLAIDDNHELFKLIGAQFGGDGKSNFALPDLRDKEPLAGLKYCIATKGDSPS